MSASKRIAQFSPIGKEVALYKDKEQFNKESEEFEKVGEYLKKNVIERRRRTNIVKEEIPGVDPKLIFLCKDVLSKEECEAVIASANENGFEFRKFEGNSKDSASSVAQAPSLAQAIYERLQPHCPEKTYFDAGPGIVLEEAVAEDMTENAQWGTLFCCNNSVRVERYYEGQKLKLHRDGCVRVTSFESVYTVYAVLIYLNDSFSDGFTQFATSRTPSEPSQLYDWLKLKGSVGDALVFRHELLHSGGSVSPLLSFPHPSVKYVLRLDLGYQLLLDSHHP